MPISPPSGTGAIALAFISAKDMEAIAMLTTMNVDDIDLDKAMLDPGAVFASPRDVLIASGLSTEDKRAILARWEEDAEALMRATGEGMPAPGLRAPGELLRAVHEAISRLDTLSGRPRGARAG